jgi:hypothetical protein
MKTRRFFVLLLCAWIGWAGGLAYSFGQSDLQDSEMQATVGGGCGCGGGGTCDEVLCWECYSASGGNFKYCGGSDPVGPGCTPEVVECGTVEFCNPGSGGCTSGGNDCSCEWVYRGTIGCDPDDYL